LLPVNDAVCPVAKLCKITDRDWNIQQQGFDQSAGFFGVPDLAPLVLVLQDELSVCDLFLERADNEVEWLGDELSIASSGRSSASPSSSAKFSATSAFWSLSPTSSAIPASLLGSNRC
jgi:hypothetical protein